jgi:hypothetical protein
MGKHSASRRAWRRWRLPAGLALGAAAAMIVAGGAAQGWFDADDPPTSATDDRTLQAPQHPGPAPSDPDESAALKAQVAAALQSCRAALAAQQGTLTTAETSLAQWQEHIDAMNLLVGGAITFADAVVFWENSRMGATENVAAFREADIAYTTLQDRCGPLESALAEPATDWEQTALEACADATVGRDAVLDAARTAVATWEHHIRDMELLRIGRLDPFDAEAMWRKNWMLGNAQMAVYRAAVADEPDGPACPLI